MRQLLTRMDSSCCVDGLEKGDHLGEECAGSMIVSQERLNRVNGGGIVKADPRKI